LGGRLDLILPAVVLTTAYAPFLYLGSQLEVVPTDDGIEWVDDFAELSEEEDADGCIVSFGAEDHSRQAAEWPVAGLTGITRAPGRFLRGWSVAKRLAGL
jgi:hypothetical protein